jgi:hypothetical protein
MKQENSMAKLQLWIAVGDYDRMRPLVDGLVQIDAVDPQFMALESEEIFFERSAARTETVSNLGSASG